MDSDTEPLDDVLVANEHEIPVDERKHNKLLDAISSLEGNKRHKLSQRTVFSNQISEFNFATSKDNLSKVQLHELVGTLKESGSHGTLKKQLSSVNRKRQVVGVPLPKHEKEKIDRTTAYETTTVDLSKWDPVVRSNRQADQLQFPLQKSNVKLMSSEQFVKRFQPRTPLEMQVAALLQGSDHVIHDKHEELTPAEQRALRAMDLQEARERRNELCRHRALLSYKEVKAKRQKKIKSKKFHRILKKERLKQETHNLEEMKTKDPDGYLEKIKELERARIQERLTLKHRGGSKFARRQMMYAKYNDKARDQVQDMLQMSREITRKGAVESDVEDMSDDDVQADSVGLTASTSASNYTYKGDNPWMAKPQPVQLTSPDLNNLEINSKDYMENGEVETEDANDSLKDSLGKMKSEKSELKNNDIDKLFEKMDRSTKKKKKDKVDTAKKMKKNKKSAKSHGKDIATTEKVDIQLEKVDIQLEKVDIQLEGDDSDKEDEGMISEELGRKRTLEDIEEMLKEDDTSPAKKPKRKEKKKNQDKKSAQKQPQKPAEPSVDPKKLFTLESRLKQIGAGPEIMDDEDEEDVDANEQQRLTIAQAFADDDVIDEFAGEKKELEERDKPKDVDLFLPGWGSWGGTGLAPPRRKRKRFIIKAKPAEPRKDVNLGNVIINENKSEAVRKHQVSEIPFPFVNASQFEQSIRAPVGQTWNPETAFQQLVQPKVVTQMGAIIAPIDKAETFKHQKTKQNPQPNDKGRESGGNRGKNKNGKKTTLKPKSQKRVGKGGKK